MAKISFVFVAFILILYIVKPSLQASVGSSQPWRSPNGCNLPVRAGSAAVGCGAGAATGVVTGSAVLGPIGSVLGALFGTLAGCTVGATVGQSISNDGCPNFIQAFGFE